EAFASGVPVVGVRSGGVGDLVHHGHNGFLSEVKNAEEMAWHIESIITDPELKKTTQQGALKTIKHYSWDAIHETLLNHYNETITNKKEKLKNAALIKPVKFENLNYVDL
ncbi:MAG: glycosyltransferase, partial [Calditrichaeota bacterium]